jgi:hypothetical protein
MKNKMKRALKKKMMVVTRPLVMLFLALCSSLQAQPSDTTMVDSRKIKSFVWVTGVAYTATLIGLSELWYKDSEKQSFAFFNDNAEWKQVDKFGHFYSAFYVSYGTSSIITSYGLQKRKADFWGSAAGFLLLMPIEILDGFSADYGASPGDLLANALGVGFYLGQASLWNEIRIQPKFSFQRTGYPDLRDNGVLGKGAVSEFVKDYNGQTYWLSFNMDKFIPFPKWLNLAAGYGATGMVYARDSQNEAAGYQAIRQYYIGLDFDFSHIKTRSKALNTMLFVVGMVRLPAPAVTFSKQGNTFRFFQF